MKNLLRGSFCPDQKEGNVKFAREQFLNSKFKNLDYLLRLRYEWMNKYIKTDDLVVDIGCGAGFSELYLDKKPILTDVLTNDWVEKVIDAQNMDFESNSIDVLISSNVLPHFAAPMKFFKESLRVLKNEGYLILHDVNNSLLLRLVQLMTKRGGWSYNVDVFDELQYCFDNERAWSSNNAIPNLIFDNIEKFKKSTATQNNHWEIVCNEHCECLSFLLSGGVTTKFWIPELPKTTLLTATKIDSFLTKCPQIFALQKRIVLQKVSNNGSQDCSKLSSPPF